MARPTQGRRRRRPGARGLVIIGSVASYRREVALSCAPRDRYQNGGIVPVHSLLRRLISVVGAESNMQETTARVELLETFALVSDRTTVHLPMAAQRLVALLAIRARPVSRRTVVSTLWFDDRNAPGSLRSAIWTLRHRESFLVDAATSELRLSPHVSVDIRDQDECARRRIACPSCPPLRGEFHRLLGDLLPGWPDEWLRAERARLRELRLHALESLARYYVDRDQVPLAIEVALAVVEADPLRESGHRVLIDAHVREGNYAGAMRQYEECVACIRKAGVSASPQLGELMRACESAFP